MASGAFIQAIEHSSFFITLHTHDLVIFIPLMANSNF